MAEFILSKDQAQEEIKDLKARISECIHAAFADWRELLTRGAELMIGSDISVQAVYLSSRIRYHLSISVDGIQSVELERKPRQSSLLIGGKMKARVKKLNRHGRPSFARTDAARRFLWQEEISFPGNERRITNVIIGFLPNEVGTEVARITCSCPYGSKSLWSFDIDAGASSTIQRIPTLPLDESPSGTIEIKPKSKKAQGDDNKK